MFEITLLGTQINWLAQIFGLIGLVLLIIGYQKPKKAFFKYQIAGAIFALVEAALLSGWTAVIRFTISIIRSLFILYCIKRDKEIPPYFAPIIIVVTIISSAFFIDVWYAILPPIFSIIFTISTCMKNYKWTKTGGATADLGSVIYCILLGAYIGAIRSFFLAISAIVSLIILNRKNRQVNSTSHRF